MEKEKVEVNYSGSVVARLLTYMKPYTKNMIICTILVLAITGFELLRPMLIGDGIDLYIEGYNKPYAMVETNSNPIQGNYYSTDLDQSNGYYAQLIYFDDEYYLFNYLDQNELETFKELSENKIEPTAIQESSIDLEGKTGTKLTKDELAVLRNDDLKGMRMIGITYMIVLLLNLVCSFFQTYILQLTGQNIIYTLRNQLFNHIHNLPLKYFDTHPVGQIVTRVTNDVESLHQMYANIIIRLFKNVVKVAGIAIMMVKLNRTLAFYTFILIPFIVILTYVSKQLSLKIHREIRTKVSMLNTFLSENISGMKLIQIFANEKMKYDEFASKSKDLYKSNIKQISVFAFFRPVIYFISELSLAIVLYYGSKNVIDTVISLGTLYVFINYISNFFEPIQDLAEQVSTLQNAFASAEKIFTVLDETNPIRELEHPKTIGKIKGKIEFKNVWFAYVGEDYVLKDVSFVIEPGQKVAFVGATGAGKSSILNLVGRYYDIQKGQILIDDVDIRELTTNEIREAIGQVQQDVFIFTGNIEENITLNNEMSEAKIVESAKTVNADHFISKLPNKYKEAVSERGATLSAGQRQLLSFARTLAFDPTILVMDEATANIDTETEALIQDALENLMKDRTTIMVAHRLSTIQHADNIIVMHKGEIREQGNHQELLKQDGIYKKLYELQLYSI